MHWQRASWRAHASIAIATVLNSQVLTAIHAAAVAAFRKYLRVAPQQCALCGRLQLLTLPHIPRLQRASIPAQLRVFCLSRGASAGGIRLLFACDIAFGLQLHVVRRWHWQHVLRGRLMRRSHREPHSELINKSRRRILVVNKNGTYTSTK